MGIFSKIGKGIKKVFKKIGRGIKKAFKAFGKFMGKIGFAGQLAMMFLFPAGIGSLLTKGLGKLGTALQAMGAKGGMLSEAFTGVGKVLTKAQKFVTTVKSGFSSLTNGIKEFGKTALSKVGIKLDGAAANFFGPDSALAKTREGFTETGKLMRGLKEGTIDITEKTSLKDFSNKVGLTQADVKRLNPNLKILKDGMIDMEGSASLSMNIDLAGDAISKAQAAAPRDAFDKALSSPEEMFSPNAGTTQASPMNPNASVNLSNQNQIVSDAVKLDEIKPVEMFSPKVGTTQRTVMNPNASTTLSNQNQFNVADAVQPIKLPDEDWIDYHKRIGTTTAEGDAARGYSLTEQRPTLESEPSKLSGYLGEVWDRSRASLDPSKAGLFRSLSNWQGLASQFMTPEEQWGGVSKGVQDLHTGYTGYTPPDDFNMFAKTTNQFGSPALGEQLRLYKIYNPFEDTMFNMRGRTA